MRLAAGLFLSLTLLLPGIADASPGHISGQSRVSGPSTLGAEAFEPGGCAWDPVASTAFPRRIGLDYEPTVAVDPTDPAHAVTTWLADDGLVVGTGTTLDGGRTWTTAPLPRVTTCSGGIHRTSLDARVSVGADIDGSALAYAVAPSQNQPLPDPRGALTYINVVTEPFDGSGWREPVVIPVSAAIDAPVIAADPSRPGSAYVMWSQRGPDATMLSSTRDGGRTWSGPAVVRFSNAGHLGLNALAVDQSG
ncbi:MAG TPA: hypothetical protein VFK89_12175, partial [Actinomycetota bacterium]|nr:hypothetical protein [Actinomycetota bacterium]